MKQERYYIKRYFKIIKMMKQERYYVKRHGGVLRSSVLAGRSEQWVSKEKDPSLDLKCNGPKKSRNSKITLKGPLYINAMLYLQYFLRKGPLK